VNPRLGELPEPLTVTASMTLSVFTRRGGYVRGRP
jgi:hypothetical protein